MHCAIATTSLLTDDDECQLDTHDCHNLGPLFQCRNTEGSYRCERKRCEPGLKLDDKGECVGIRCSPGYEAGFRGKCYGIRISYFNTYFCRTHTAMT